MSKTTNIKTSGAVERAEMRSLGEAELDAVVGGDMNCELTLATVQCPIGYLSVMTVSCTGEGTVTSVKYMH
jgi:hypothetical protein